MNLKMAIRAVLDAKPKPGRRELHGSWLQLPKSVPNNSNTSHEAPGRKVAWERMPWKSSLKFQLGGENLTSHLKYSVLPNGLSWDDLTYLWLQEIQIISKDIDPEANRCWPKRVQILSRSHALGPCILEAFDHPFWGWNCQGENVFLDVDLYYMFQWHWLCRDCRGLKTFKRIKALYSLSKISFLWHISSNTSPLRPFSACRPMWIRSSRKSRPCQGCTWRSSGGWSRTSHAKKSYSKHMGVAASGISWRWTPKPRLCSAAPTTKCAQWTSTKQKSEA